jgi:hypothetical protein
MFDLYPAGQITNTIALRLIDQPILQRELDLWKPAFAIDVQQRCARKFMPSRAQFGEGRAQLSVRKPGVGKPVVWPLVLLKISQREDDLTTIARYGAAIVGGAPRRVART